MFERAVIGCARGGQECGHSEFFADSAEGLSSRAAIVDRLAFELLESSGTAAGRARGRLNEWRPGDGLVGVGEQGASDPSGGGIVDPG